MAELQLIKKQVGQASQNLLAQPTQIEEVPEMPVADQLRQAQELVAQASQVGGMVDLTEEVGDEPIDVESAPESKVKKGSLMPKFRAAAALPSKVANRHVKQKAEKKDREEKLDAFIGTIWTEAPMNMLIKYSMMFALYYNLCVRGKTFQIDCKGKHLLGRR